jgi:hypothetical protein
MLIKFSSEYFDFSGLQAETINNNFILEFVQSLPRWNSLSWNW